MTRTEAEAAHKTLSEITVEDLMEFPDVASFMEAKFGKDLAPSVPSRGKPWPPHLKGPAKDR
jgi:hypothetical protein